MYRTSRGDRVLEGAERQLFVQALATLVDQFSDADSEFGIPPFDELQRNQKIAALHMVARGLLCPDQPPPPLTAVLEATVAAIYVHAGDMLDSELVPDPSDFDESLLALPTSWSGNCRRGDNWSSPPVANRRWTRTCRTRTTPISTSGNIRWTSCSSASCGTPTGRCWNIWTPTPEQSARQTAAGHRRRLFRRRPAGAERCPKPRGCWMNWSS